LVHNVIGMLTRTAFDDVWYSETAMTPPEITKLLKVAVGSDMLAKFTKGSSQSDRFGTKPV